MEADLANSAIEKFSQARVAVLPKTA